MKTEYEETEGMKFWAPLWEWTTVQVWDYIKEHNLKRSPIYDTMHISGDCLCGSFSTRGESNFLQMFHPELANRLIELEKKYGGKWGNQISLTDMKKQSKLDDLICTECHI